ncbi:hypothetical protein SAY87_032360 [Trapa incisa]|uniref:GTD-binding domain-containing protein n=1 Tax=Trapa incisa TaxID=236973 RepID=A0AAN7JFN7_9MYRT|nr:hypothetical protein SAY87_032360 [Trapa incisa]
MEIHLLEPLREFVAALLSLDRYTKIPLVDLLCKKSAEFGFAHLSEFVAGFALFFAFSVGLKVLKLGTVPEGHLRRDLSRVDVGCQTAEGSESFPGEDGVFDEVALRRFSLRSDTVCDKMELPAGLTLLIESRDLLSNDNPHYSVTASSQDSETEELFPEDQTSEVPLLRELVKFERQRAETALSELENERFFSSTAAEEAMSMIFQLQTEKSSIQIESSQYRRLAEEKQAQDQEVIRFLRSIIWEMEKDDNAMDDEAELAEEED